MNSASPRVAPYFSFVSGSEFDGRRNAKAEVIDYALSHFGITEEGKEACIMVGDRRHEIDFVVNLDQLKGTWCYVVMPKWRDADNPFQGARANMSQKDLDSLKNEYFIPREYGFSLKRQWTAQSVGYVRQNALQSESPVVYPQLLYFTEWHILNGRLVMTSGEFRKTGKNEAMEVVNNRQDTCDIVLLTEDSLVLSSEGESRGYYRRSNTADINKEARQKAAEQQKRALESR